MIVIAHRGASAYAPQNTAPAFELAKKMNADGIECDVHFSADGELIVCHDPVPTYGCGYDSPPICTQTLAELKKLEMTYGMEGFAGNRIITLDEMLEIVSDMRLINIEIKPGPDGKPYEGILPAVIEKLRAHKCFDRTIISSFIHATAKEATDCGLSGAILYGELGGRDAQYGTELGVNGLHPFFGQLRQETVRGAKAAGLYVNAWTVDEPEDMLRLKEWGVDGIITNKPDVGNKTVK